MEVGQSIEDDRRALEAEGAVKIRKIEVDFEHFEVGTARNLVGTKLPLATAFKMLRATHDG